MFILFILPYVLFAYCFYHFITLQVSLGKFPPLKSKFFVVKWINVIFQGPVDVGINLVTNDRITAMMLDMASSDDSLLQSTAAELIVHTVSKHERATTILKVCSCLSNHKLKKPDKEASLQMCITYWSFGSIWCSKINLWPEVLYLSMAMKEERTA